MGASVDFLLRDKATGRLSYRRVFPAELRPFIDGAPIQLKRSLSASRIDAFGAMERYQGAAAEYDRIVTLARKAAAQAFDALDAAQIAFLAETYRALMLADDAERRVQGKRSSDDLLEINDTEYRDAYASGSPADIKAMFGSDATELTASRGLLVDPASPDFARLCSALLEAAIKANDDRAMRNGGLVVPTPEKPTQRLDAHASRTIANEDAFATIAERILTSKAEPVSGSTQQATRTALRFWREAHGDPVPSVIKKAHVTQFVELLTQRPAALPTKDKKLSLKALAEKYAGSPLPRLSGKSVNQHVGMLSGGCLVGAHFQLSTAVGFQAMMAE